MSLTVVASVVVGFKCRLEPVYETKTRYNPETGEPYEVQVETHKVAMCGDVEVASSKCNLDAFVYGGLIEEGVETYRCSGFIEDGIVIGARIGNVQFAPGIDTFNYRVPDAVHAMGERLGLTPVLHLVLYIC